MIVRRRYHYAAVYLAPHVISSQKVFCGQSLSVIQDDNVSNVHFSGFTAPTKLTINNAALITDITGFTYDDYIAGDWISFSPNQIFLGIYDDGVKMIIQDKAPVMLPYKYERASSPKVSNVVSIDSLR